MRGHLYRKYAERLARDGGTLIQPVGSTHSMLRAHTCRALCCIGPWEHLHLRGRGRGRWEIAWWDSVQNEPGNPTILEMIMKDA